MYFHFTIYVTLEINIRFLSFFYFPILLRFNNFNNYDFLTFNPECF